MNFDPPEPQVWTDDRCHEVVLAVWPQARYLPPRELKRLYATVRDVVDGMPIPTMSQQERETIKEAAEAVEKEFYGTSKASKTSSNAGNRTD